jgi:hypothetical protein
LALPRIEGHIDFASNKICYLRLRNANAWSFTGDFKTKRQPRHKPWSPLLFPEVYRAAPRSPTSVRFALLAQTPSG